MNRLKDEIVTEIILPNVHEDGTSFVFEKVANRRADAIAKISFAGSMRVDEGRIGDTICIWCCGAHHCTFQGY
ncbi:hypothetical protein [Ammoniphilus sp. 3BR4]|uniref:hypothetical protein n=1 Tax=Ammoniphilus sp. 3BR4 TaxID=3158265 RepID=UPI003467EC43